VLLADLVETSAAVAAIPSRRSKIQGLANCLGRAAGEEVAVATGLLSGNPRQRRLGVGWASLRDRPPPAQHPSLRVLDVDAVFDGLEAAAGSGSGTTRSELLKRLFQAATAPEQEFLMRLIGGELRHGAQAGIMAEAIASAAGVSPAAVRRAAMLSGDLRVTGRLAMESGAQGLHAVSLTPGIPVQPMLAQSAPTLREALARTGPAAVDWKLDGVRVQAHRRGDQVEVFTRTLEPITDRVPEVVEAIRGLSVDTAILDGEVILLDAQGRPRPFQETGSRVASRRSARVSTPARLSFFVFDALHLDGADLIDLPAMGRFEAARHAVPESLWVPRILDPEPSEAERFYEDALRRGHEGVVVKNLSSAYEAGRRGAGWIKVKSPATLDLVVLAAEWGHGRRTGRLSNLHLGARDVATGGFAMLGKTFKGMTDAMLAWQTERLQELQLSSDGWTVRVRPELVVEVAFDGIQASRRYPSGMALRFARVVRYRPDKSPSDADTVETVRQLHRDR